MTLSEAQIQRYSRQILLREVGGVGQVRLLSSPMAIDGAGPAFDTAASYLAAGGAPVRLRGAWLEGFDPEVDRASPLAVTLGETDELSAHQVAVGTSRGETVVLFRAADGCRACFAQACAELAPAPLGAGSTVAGTFAALVCQKLVLGQLSGVGAFRLDGAAVIARAPLRACQSCTGAHVP